MPHIRPWVLLPVKDPALGKTRLAPLLDGGERAELARRMLDDVLSTLARCPSLTGVLVITADESTAHQARTHGARVLAEQGAGLNRALVQARDVLVEEAAEALLVLPADLPLLDASALGRLLDACGPPPAAVLVGDRRDDGTNAFLCAPASLLQPGYGPGSLARHRQSLLQAGVRVVEPEISELRLDVDLPEDVAHLLRGRAVAESSQAVSYLARIDAAGRLRDLAARS